MEQLDFIKAEMRIDFIINPDLATAQAIEKYLLKSHSFYSSGFASGKVRGAFGSGKTTCAFELNRRLPNSFVYDPENIGYFIRNNTPKEIHKSDFQDHGQWRLFNYEMLKYIATEYLGIIIVPMTINNHQYYEEIIQRLIDDGMILKHYILYANKETILKRLNKRLERGETWAKSQIDRCIEVFDSEITEEKVITDNRNIDYVVEEIAKISGITLLPDKKQAIEKLSIDELNS